MTLPGPGGLRVAAVDRTAAQEGLRPGMTLAHARAMLPHVEIAAADPVADREALLRLAAWTVRYTPWAAPDGDDGLILDITGCAHLFGGEGALIADVVKRLRRFGFTARAAIADTPAAAWAWSRYGETRGDAAVVPEGAVRTVLASLPMAALRIESALEEGLRRLGLRVLSDVWSLPRAPLVRRFGVALPQRLDQLLGREHEPISPLRPPPIWQARLQFPEPIVHRDAVEIALVRLLDSLCALLRDADQGARDLCFTLSRVDCTVQEIAVGTSRPVREPKHLARLFAERLDTINAGFGIETAMLAATRVEPFTAVQTDLNTDDDETAPLDAAASERLWALVDRLENRFGRDRVRHLAAVESHIPEKAVRTQPVRRLTEDVPLTWPRQEQRPLTLLASPEPITAMALMPDDPPMSFTWRRVSHRVARAEGPERIDPEWWRQAQSLPDRRRCRDYYRVEDAQGCRFWIFREGLYGLAPQPRWFMHGVFP